MGTSRADYQKETGDSFKSGRMNIGSQRKFNERYQSWLSAKTQRAKAEPTVGSATQGDTSLYSRDSDIAVGQKIGRQRFKDYYGQEVGQTGEDVQNVKGKLKARMEGTDPISGQQQNAMNRSLRRMKSQGASDQQVESASRTNALNYSSDAFSRGRTSINDYRSLLGNLLSGGQNLEMGFASLEKGQDVVQQPRYSSGGLSVICTELHRQGIMPSDIYEKDREYGRYMLENHIYTFIGYLFWARSVVSLMQNSRLFTKIISIPAMAWANHIAGNKNFLGSILKKVGEPICSLLGKLVIWRKKWSMERRS